MPKTIMVDIDNTIADYTNGLRDYIRECGHGEDECPCPEPTAYDFTLTDGWPFSGDPKAFTWWHTRAVADGLYSREEPYTGAPKLEPAARCGLERHHGDQPRG